MDNGLEIFVKLLIPMLDLSIFFKKKQVVASEITTREMLYNVFKIATPRVLSWFFDAGNNSVNAEYIIEEKITRVQ
ncbi:hypothetical protein PENSTE_c009G05782 [Penicillium steckii]|uniref:Uncharacterized protein n=1 Tax=Penicillium steckii TaxID=303698 RepID=A0A1V6TB38_9EURO|nr:hypothetical protein PENSTE_c009G05782 [Penicillium steckii]